MPISKNSGKKSFLMKHIKTVVFDLDGTLLDSIPDIASAMNTVLSENSLPTHTREEYISFIGDGVAQLVHRSLGKQDIPALFEKVRREYSAQYSAHAAEKTEPFDGILQALDALTGSYRLAILSNKGDADVKKLTVQYFGTRFASALGQFGNYKVKPSPDLLFVTAKELGVSEKDLIFVGDSPVDVETAHAAGIPCIAVEWGYRTREQLIAAGCDYLCKQPTDLPAVIREADV